MDKVKKFIAKNSFIWPVIGSILLYLGIALKTGRFNLAVLISAAKLCTFTLLLALGQMIVVTSGNGAIDLSQKYILTLTAYIASGSMRVNIVMGLALAIALGAMCGLLNSYINLYLNVPAMITTLATGYLYYTIILVVSSIIPSAPVKAFVAFVNSSLLGINTMTIICIVVALALWLLLYHTKYGKNLHAVGQKREAARLAGINVYKTVIIAFVINGALCGLAGALCGAYAGGANQDLGTTYFLPSVAATFVGGTVASGGKSSVVGVSIGALMMTLMSTFLTAAKLEVGYNRLIQGAFLVFLLVLAVSDSKGHK